MKWNWKIEKITKRTRAKRVWAKTKNQRCTITQKKVNWTPAQKTKNTKHFEWTCSKKEKNTSRFLERIISSTQFEPQQLSSNKFPYEHFSLNYFQCFFRIFLRCRNYRSCVVIDPPGNEIVPPVWNFSFHSHVIF